MANDIIMLGGLCWVVALGAFTAVTVGFVVLDLISGRYKRFKRGD